MDWIGRHPTGGQHPDRRSERTQRFPRCVSWKLRVPTKGIVCERGEVHPAQRADLEMVARGEIEIIDDRERRLGWRKGVRGLGV